MRGIPTFILTIEPIDGRRRSHCRAECARLNLAANFVEGVQSQDPSLSSLYSHWRNIAFRKRSMSSGEIACYEGHRRTWAALLENGANIALICEDDFKSLDDERFKAALQAAIVRDDWDLLKFFDFKPKKILNEVNIGPVSIVDYKYPATGAVCYLIRSSAAKRLLQRRKVFRPVDEDFSAAGSSGYGCVRSSRVSWKKSRPILVGPPLKRSASVSSERRICFGLCGELS